MPGRQNTPLSCMASARFGSCRASTSGPPDVADPITLRLRDYQSETVAALHRSMAETQDTPLVDLPTASGKSVVIAQFIVDRLRSDPATRIVTLTHTKELIAQNHWALQRLCPRAPAGILSAGLNLRQTDAPILFASIQSSYKNAGAIGRRDLC